MASKEKILSKAAELIHTKGYNHTSIKDILEAAVVTKSNFYYHFESKEQLAFEMLTAGKRGIDRINAINASRPITNYSKLHELREIRNSISHEQNPPTLSWEDVNNAADEVEKVLIELDVLSFHTNFKLGNIEKH